MEGTTVLEGAATALWAYTFQPLGFLGLRIEHKHIVVVIETDEIIASL
jgi:hypothetical protein